MSSLIVSAGRAPEDGDLRLDRGEQPLGLVDRPCGDEGSRLRECFVIGALLEEPAAHGQTAIDIVFAQRGLELAVALVEADIERDLPGAVTGHDGPDAGDRVDDRIESIVEDVRADAGAVTHRDEPGRAAGRNIDQLDDVQDTPVLEGDHRRAALHREGGVVVGDDPAAELARAALDHMHAADGAFGWLLGGGCGRRAGGRRGGRGWWARWLGRRQRAGVSGRTRGRRLPVARRAGDGQQGHRRGECRDRGGAWAGHCMIVREAAARRNRGEGASQPLSSGLNLRRPR